MTVEITDFTTALRAFTIACNRMIDELNLAIRLWRANGGPVRSCELDKATMRKGALRARGTRRSLLPLERQAMMQTDAWYGVKDGDDRARALMRRHYSWYEYSDGRPHLLFVGPGEKMVLLTADCRAVFVWRKYLDDGGQLGVNCAAFRNESDRLSSELIREAVEVAWRRWPGERLFTFVDPRKVRSTNPGYCFIRAGWRRCGVTKRRRYVILEMLPHG